VPVTETPYPTSTPLPAGVSVSYSESLTISESITISELIMEVTSVTQSNLVIYTVREISVRDDRGSDSVTTTIVSVDSAYDLVMTSMTRLVIEMPVFVTRVVQVVRVIRVTPVEGQEDDGLGTPVLIGIVSGAAVVVAFIAWAVREVVKSRRGNGGIATSDSAAEVEQSVTPMPNLENTTLDGDEVDEELGESLKQFGDHVDETIRSEEIDSDDAPIYV
jgi:hypothetical protein